MKLLIIFIMLLIPLSVYGEEYTHIRGEDFFNDTADNIISGNFTLNPVELMKTGTDKLFEEFGKSRSEMAGILVIAAMSGVLKAIKTGGESETADGVEFACFMLMTVSAIRIFSHTVGYGVEVIKDLSTFITKLSPVFVALLVSGGTSVTAAAFHPILSGAVYVMTVVVDKCIVPLVYLSAVLGIVGHITPRLQLTAFTKLIRGTGKWILLMSLTIFTGVTAAYGFAAPGIDAIALRSMKFAVGSFVPVVGGLLSDTVETVLSGTRLMKNAVGTAGIIAVTTICVVPIIKILVIKIMLEVCTAVAEPLADKRIMGMLKDISASVSMVLGMVITVSMLFIICIAIILSVTG